MLRPAISDPVLIKPNQADFLKDWSIQDPNSSPNNSLYGVFATIPDVSPPDSKMPKAERERRQKRFEFHLKRRASILMANSKDDHYFPNELRRSWSCTELGRTCCRETTQTKRVSFSVTVPPPSYQSISKSTFDLCPPKFQARPILVRRNTTFSGKEGLTHMDFESFSAWRRGSRMNADVEKTRQKKKDKEQRRARARKEREASGKSGSDSDGSWFYRVMKMGFDNCFQRRRVNPTPQPEAEDSISISVISINAS